MNHIYRSIWSESLSTWIAVPENTASKGKRSSVRNAVLATGLAICSSASWALPTGGQVVAGQVSVNTPSATQMNIHQGSQNAIVNWNGFSIAAPETVTIQQPNVSAVLLNRVVGMDASLIQGHLNANGQVYLVNPNGVLFSNTAQVDVGGLVASTHNISNADLMNGTYHFTQEGATGAVSNQGVIKTPIGGTVALIGTQVSNSGSIETPHGTTVLAAGATVDLDFKGDGLVEVKVPQAALNAQVANRGAIMADAGRVVLTAKAAGQLAATVINQTGLIRANSLVSRNGEILLDGGDKGAVQAGGILDVSGQNANGGTLKALAGMQDGTLNVTGKLDASASGTANGGFIETSAAHVKVADSAKVSTLAAKGLNGTWLIDPVNFTVAASGGDITGAAVGSALAGGNFTVQSSTGDVNVNDAVTWSANQLTLNAQRNININAPLNATGSTGTGTGQLSLLYGQASATGNASDNYFISNGAKVDLAAGQNFSTQKGTMPANLINYTVITDLGAANSTTGTDLQGINGGLANNYALGANIDTAATPFTPLGTLSNQFSGLFEGLGHSISNLLINSPTTTAVGLFGAISSSSVISNLTLLNANVTGDKNTGALVGTNYGGIIKNVGATGQIAGNVGVGGLVGVNNTGGSINNSYAIVTVSGVTGSSYVGGLVGGNYGSITNAYASGIVTGSNFVGGLAGGNYGGIITNAYAAGVVNNGIAGATIGGLVGSTKSVGSGISNSFWDTNATGQSSAVGTGDSTGATGQTTAQMMQVATFSSWGTDITNTGGVSTVWRNYEGNTAPLLRSFLTPYTLPNSVTNTTVTYNGSAQSATAISPADPKVLAASATNVGSYNAYYSNQQGYDITGSASLIINPAVLNASAVNLSGTRSYDGTNIVNASIFSLGGLLNGDTLGLSGAGTIASKNVGTYSGVDFNLGSLTLGNCTGVGCAGLASNYTLTGGTHSVTINPANYTAITGTKTYDGTVTFTAANAATVAGVNGETFAISTADSNDKNVATANTFTSAGTLTGNTVNDLTTNYNALNLSNLTGTNNVATINKADLTLAGSRAYDGTTITAGSILTATGVANETFAVTGAGNASNLASKNVQTNSNLATLTGLALGTSSNGGLSGNYNNLSTTGSAITINQAGLTVTANAVTKTYDGGLTAAGTGTVGTLVTGDAVNSAGSQAFLDKNVGIGDKIVRAFGVTIKDSSNADMTGNYAITYTDDTASTINKADYTQIAGSKTYDGNITFTAANAATVAGVNGETFAVSTADSNDKNVATANTFVSAGTLTGNTVNDLTTNYNALNLTNLTGTNNVATINKADLTLAGSRAYDGTTITAGSILTATGVANETFAVTGAGDASNLASKNVQTNSNLVTLTGLALGTSNNGGLSSNYNNLSTVGSAITVTQANPPATSDANSNTAEQTSAQQKSTTQDDSNPKPDTVKVLSKSNIETENGGLNKDGTGLKSKADDDETYTYSLIDKTLPEAGQISPDETATSSPTYTASEMEVHRAFFILLGRVATDTELNTYKSDPSTVMRDFATQAKDSSVFEDLFNRSATTDEELLQRQTSGGFLRELFLAGETAFPVSAADKAVFEAKLQAALAAANKAK